MREAAPSPRKKPSEKVNAPGGKSNAMRGLKCVAPVTITAITVTNVPAQSETVILGLTHPNYGHMVVVPPETRAELAKDFD